MCCGPSHSFWSDLVCVICVCRCPGRAVRQDLCVCVSVCVYSSVEWFQISPRCWYWGPSPPPLPLWSPSLLSWCVWGVRGKRTHTHTCGLQELSIGIMVFILYKQYILYFTCPQPTTYTSKQLMNFQKHCLVCLKPFGLRDTGHVLINHVYVVIPMSLYKFASP